MRRPFPFHSNAVWPPLFLAMIFLVAYGMVEGCFWFIQVMMAKLGGTISETDPIVRLRGFILIGAAGVYAVYRLWRFHPACNQAYSAWLNMSPWTAAKPLPLGPVHLVWQDAIVIAVLMALSVWHAHSSAALPVAVFGLTYLVGMTLLLAFTRQWSSCLLLGFLWPSLILPGMRGIPSIAVVVAIIAVVWHGHRKCLRAFPWDHLVNSSRITGSGGGSLLQTRIRVEFLSNTPANRASSNVGWPFLALSPKVEVHSVSTLASFYVSALVGWGSFCALERLKFEPLPEIILLLAMAAAFVRLAIYCSGVAPPFDLLGRIASGRIVLPGFDKVFLTPLAAVMVAAAGWLIVRRSGSWYPVAESSVIALVWFVLLAGGPTLRNWVLTGQHRFHFSVKSSLNKQLLRST